MTTPAHEHPAPGSARWLVPVALFISLAVAFLDRMNLSFALKDMARDYDWTIGEVGRKGGALMGVFFMGYGLSNIFLGGVAGRIGPRRSLLTIVLLFSLFTILGAPAAGISFLLFGATRLMLGVSEGVHFPMMAALTKNWFPRDEHARANSIWVAGVLLATLIAPQVLPDIIGAWGWRTMLVITGALGLFISWPVVWLLIHDSPAASPRISEPERRWLLARLAAEPQPSSGGAWDFLFTGNFHLALCGAILNNLFAMGFLMWLPTYFTEVRGMSSGDLKWAATLPYVFGLAGLAFYGWLGDRLGRRALLAGAGYAIAGMFAFAATRAPSPALTVAIFSLAAFFHATYTSQEWAIIQRILPPGAIARGSGVYNGLGILIGGGFGQIVIGEVIAQTGDYTAAIVTITVSAFAAAATMFVLSRRLGA